MAASDPWVALGVVTGPHGLRGELRVKAYNPDSELLLASDAVTLRRGDVTQEHKLGSARPHKQGWLMTLPGITNREQAEDLRGSEICLRRSELPPLGEGEFYFVDLLAKPVRRPDGQAVGTVTEVRSYPASDVLCVETPAGLLEIPLCDPYLVEALADDGAVVVTDIDELEPEPPRRKPKTKTKTKTKTGD